MLNVQAGCGNGLFVVGEDGCCLSHFAHERVHMRKLAMRGTELSLWVVIIASVAIAASALGQTINVPNGDCESGSWAAASTGNLGTLLPNWTFSASAGTLGNWYHGKTTWSANTGTGSGGCRITNGGSKVGSYKRTVGGLAPNGKYKVSAWLRANTNAAGSFVDFGARTGGTTVGYTWACDPATHHNTNT